MKITYSIKTLVLLLAVSMLVWACEINGEENFSIRPGSGLHIIGEDAVTASDTLFNEYYVDGFTVNEAYEWRLNDAVIQPDSGRGGEFVTIAFPTPGVYTLSVSNGTYSGTLSIEAAAPEPEDGE